MRRGIVTLAFVTMLGTPIAAVAKPADPRAQRQASLNDDLTIRAASNIAAGRASCASGGEVAAVAKSRASLRLQNLPDAVDYCVTVLIRTARDGGMHYLRSPDGKITAALALDTGFVAGYRKAGSADALPAMSAIRETAERCLSLSEADTALCYSLGYAYGVRAANGETVTAR